jgi:O-antigen/teichoic acid export membrane protein
MGLRQKLLGGGGLLAGGQVLGQACSFARNVVVARMLTPDDFGIAATLGIAMSMFEMVSNLAVDRLLVQAEDGDEPAFQATAQLFHVLRGIGIAALLFALAWPFSRLYNIHQALWAFQCVALVPLLRGFIHLDAKRMQREYRFGADVAIELVSQIVLVLSAWPIAWWFKDYSAMLWLLILQALVAVAMSHAVSKRPYAWAWDRVYFNRMCVFGWPLLFNGLLMFLIFQSDRMIIGSVYDITLLGIYSAAFSITFVPSMIISNVASTLLLPVLSKNKGDSERFAEYYSLSIIFLCLLGVVATVGFIILGQRVVELTFGEKYASVEAFIGWLALMHMLRTIRFAPTLASMALGDTVAPMIANIARAALVPVGLGVAISGEPLVWLVIVGCVSELVSLNVILGRLKRQRGLRKSLCLNPLSITLVATALAYLATPYSSGASLTGSAGVIFAITISVFVALLAISGSLRQVLRGAK